MKNLYLGTSGYNYKDWKGKFYPEGLGQRKWLSYYAQYFNTVEINATFYGSFKRNVFENWANQTGKEFCFAIKGSRFITHVRRLENIDDSVELFFEQVKGLGNKLGVILWQFPPNFKLTTKNFERIEWFTSALNQHASHPISHSHPDPLPSRERVNVYNVYEFRDESWFKDEIFTLLSQNKIGFVINDSAVFPSVEKVTGGFVYIRFHGPTSLYSSCYSDQQLEIWADKIKNYLKEYDVYCYFNNDISGFAIENVKKIKELIYE